ncbi:MAG TPA: methyltransferase domain-containing protein, partial [Candidatus Dormibacteraeota bacterium]|nr:methyltransferase domain-containing protein [Candidatus Dormibacteraeota bacterium]
MAGKPPSLRSEAWQSVDASANPAAYVAYLDRGAANLEWARREVVRSLNVTPGCSVLDVGSGAGEFLIEIAGSVDGVRAVGIDPSDVMVKAATQRARAAGVEVT